MKERSLNHDPRDELTATDERFCSSQEWRMRAISLPIGMPEVDVVWTSRSEQLAWGRTTLDLFNSPPNERKAYESGTTKLAMPDGRKESRQEGVFTPGPLPCVCQLIRPIYLWFPSLPTFFPPGPEMLECATLPAAGGNILGSSTDHNKHGPGATPPTFPAASPELLIGPEEPRFTTSNLAVFQRTRGSFFRVERWEVVVVFLRQFPCLGIANP
ncbi:uncharacterized protein CLUP02_15169 [Colletotrichum lupini]|uniref:Uncharacterized protein n=1 Tax=Colletotrichum lupini TaxID=145971 RepID=A0A9Q8T5K1_9PEZI|nr:uncharacterized protein CLUP02_15169 [Colletotrichum lupini]UQC89638.1 hypothetical protein CLUP02_15169 [Colletotrichum lupini]